MKFNDQQIEAIVSKKSKIVINAAAASGKTAILTARIKYLLSEGADPTKLVAITFTNQATEVLRKRLGEKANGMYIGTIHGYCNYLLKSGSIDTSDIISEENFDELFTRIKKNPQCIKPVDYLLLDEAQDSTDFEFDFILEMVKPKNWMLVGDFHQQIYQFRQGNAKRFRSMMNDPDVQVYYLSENYRCKKEILDFAKRIISKNGIEYIDYSHQVLGQGGKVYPCQFKKSILKEILFGKIFDNYKDWFILCRSNKQLEEVARYLKEWEVPFDTFRQAQLTNDELQEKMEQNTIKLLTIHSAKGLEAENVIVIGAKIYNEEETCIAYVGATRAKTNLYWMSYIPTRGPKVTSWE